ncbi:MBL fold metallo-hydrolase [Deinococcus metallilatus]|uniref:Glyoxylase-like metal-dependent hydrolase (Beta-lactamase superfamily II) n=1 Tax=Deinococcus metallilatus TaxID=1211322 RepID=A0AAJ5F2M1_9DEIO|nr:MBL fold metallo-hydrolase [Deinococcus metallilatus]MBB5295206.1 glyoxylase-like metal-dependent hydrolase (beta-lactamase superfamily II) [Deinococcus metallilatus]QBY08629.1 MBL fold metallo-hydrolase [Deinococcus metallilatus]RXJ10508.1 MBL fold metallo-hydrolase [Deinococcus metallilatus]TLK26479.1 MBL fold metallo-hydrolase [Deinococcus metallilatus]GMA14980.1 MBL fold hydrolase [Deinococcus metallilatus]
MTGPQRIDLNFQDVPGVIAAHVLDTGDGLAIVDVGPGSTLPALEAGLSDLGASLSDVRHVLLTHIHLDHAGATGTILDRVPKARAYVHERGAAHLSRPERLLASAGQIYGDQMERLWGEMRPIDPDRLKVLEGGESLKIGQAEVRPLYTPGHAVHHLAYHVGDDLFVGDVGGVRLDPRQTPRAPTPPPDINLPAWRESIAALRDVDARTLYLAHFGSHSQEAAHWDRLLEMLEQDADRVRAGLDTGEPLEGLTERFTAELLDELREEAPELPERYEFACPPWMSVQGLVRYWQRAAARGTESRSQG